MKKDLQTIYESPLTDCLSLFDEQFTIDELGQAVDDATRKSNSVIESTRNAIRKAVSCQDDEDYKFVVQLEDDMKAAIDSGDIKLVTNAEGEIFAQLRQSNGHFGSKLPIKKELHEEGLSVESVEMALQMEMIKDQLKSIVETMQSIEGRVVEVLQGQHNDRIGLFYSGLSLYAEASNIRDEGLRKQLMSQAIKSLSDANSQMIQEIRTSVGYLVTEQYKSTKKMGEKIEEHLGIIHQCFDVVYRASFLKATIYQQNGELPAMLTAIDEYGRFVDKMIVPYAGKLTELDRNSEFIDTGAWGTISNTLVGCRKLKQQICTRDTYYLEIGE